jgi:Beta-lactamase enzyme family/Bacterial tandem repeat domain 1
MVKNSGAYKVPGWWWYYGLTGNQVSNKLSENKARLIHVQPYVVNGATRFAVIMVNNTGDQAREWYWGYGTTASNIGNHLSNKGTRLTDLETYFEGANKRYAFISVKNSGGDTNAWSWWLNQSASGLADKLGTRNRLIDLERLPNDTFNAVMVQNSETDSAGWWYQYGLTSLTALNQYAGQLGIRPIDIETYVRGKTRFYDGVFIDNSNAATRRIRGIFAEALLDLNGNPTRGIFEAYLKRVDSSVLVNLNSARRAETASSLKALHLLHAMREVAGPDTLGASFIYYDYPNAPYNANTSNACPVPSDETKANSNSDYDLEKGLDEMMSISDNRTTRGVVLRYGGFDPLNATAALFDMTGTTLRHNIGCAYRVVGTNNFSTALRNDTTAADLAHLYETVWNSTSLSGIFRAEFLESANPRVGANGAVQAIIDDEAADLGLSSETAADFGERVRTWDKGGGYNATLPASDGSAGQSVIVRSGAGIIRLPIKVGRGFGYRNFVFAHLISDVPVGCFGCITIGSYENTYSEAANELFREQIRSALETW